MTGTFARLSPLERRFLVGVLVAVFMIANFWWVWPHFGDRQRTQKKLVEARELLKKYVAETNQIPKLEAQVISLESAESTVPLEDQARQFTLTIKDVSQKDGVSISAGPAPTTRDSQFFIEQIQNVPVLGTDKQIVNFLYDLGSGNSTIRARDFSLHPDGPRYQLGGTITLMASYQKNPAARPAPKAPAAVTNASKSSTPNKKR